MTRSEKVGLVLFILLIVVALADFVSRNGPFRLPGKPAATGARASAAARPTNPPTATRTPRAPATPLPSPTPAVTVTPSTSPTATVTASPTVPPPGSSRSKPLPQGSVVRAPNWEVQVRAIVRGDAAYQMLRPVNPNGIGFGPGEEMLLLRLHVRSLYEDRDQARVFSGYDVHITGDRCILYIRPPLTEPEPALDLRLKGGEEAEGWVAFRIWAAEGNLVLQVDERVIAGQADARYVALGAGAPGCPPDGPAAPTADPYMGRERGSAAPRGVLVTSYGWNLRVTDVVRGAAAWKLIQSSGQWSLPPEGGLEYVAVRLWVQNVSEERSGIGHSDFYSIGSLLQKRMAPYNVYGPQPMLDPYLPPGGEDEGWIVVLADQNDANLVLIYDPISSMKRDTIRYLSLE